MPYPARVCGEAIYASPIFHDWRWVLDCQIHNEGLPIQIRRGSGYTPQVGLPDKIQDILLNFNFRKAMSTFCSICMQILYGKYLQQKLEKTIMPSLGEESTVKWVLLNNCRLVYPLVYPSVSVRVLQRKKLVGDSHTIMHFFFFFTTTWMSYCITQFWHYLEKVSDPTG